jgi:DNA-binding SARP family transcriptional activator
VLVPGSLEFRILGPLEVLADNRLVELSSPWQRALLVALLLRPNRVVGLQRLIDDVWAQTPPANADAALRMAVSRLRRQLDAGSHGSAVLTRPGGYLLRIDLEQVDAWRFERTLAEGQQALAEGAVKHAAERLRVALELWRGPVLADVLAMPLVAAEAVRLEAARVAALRARVEADQVCGRDAEALAGLEVLVAAHPLDEGLSAGLMRSLCRVGRQADALAVFRRLRGRLVEELGVEPSAALQRLERQVLSGDPALEPVIRPAIGGGLRVAAGVVPGELPADVASFTGRQEELAELERMLTAAAEGGPVAASVVQGAGGIGKSALAVHAAHRLTARYPDGQLYVNLHGATLGLRRCGRWRCSAACCARSASIPCRSPPKWRRRRRGSGRWWLVGGSWWCWTTLVMPRRCVRCCLAVPAAGCW